MDERSPECQDSAKGRAELQAPASVARTWNERGATAGSARGFLCASRAADAAPSTARSDPKQRLNVVIQLELGRDRAHPDVVGLVLALVRDPGIDEIRGEHISLHQEGAV